MLIEMIDDELKDESQDDEAETIEWALDLCTNIDSMPQESRAPLMCKIADRLTFLFDADSKMPTYDLHANLSGFGFDEVLTEDQFVELADMILLSAGGDPAHGDFAAAMRDEEWGDDDDDFDDLFDDEED